MILDTIKLDERLAALNHKQRVAFAASCCERLLPNYEIYCKFGGEGNSALMRQLLELIWDFVVDKASIEELSQATRQAQSLIMESESSSSPFFSQALDAWDSITSTAESCIDESREAYMTVPSACIDTIHAYLYQVNDPDPTASVGDNSLDLLVDSLPLMQREVDVMDEALVLLKTRALTSNVVGVLRSTSNRSGIQPSKRSIFLIL